MNRRDFLWRAAGAGAMAVMPGLRGASGGARPIRKGIMWGTIGVSGSVLEKLQAVRTAGFEGVEPMGGMDVDEMAEGLRATGLQAGSVCCHTHWAKPLTDPNPVVRQAGLDGLLRSLRDAHRYGARSVLLVPGVVNEGVAYDAAYRRSQEEIRKAIPLAEELGVSIAIENVWNNFLLSPIEAARFVDELESPQVGWHFDCGNVIHYGWAEQWIRILGRRIITLHIKEFSRARAEKEGRWAGFRAGFLEGDNRWPAIMAALDEIGFQGWGIAEQGGGDSAEGLKRLSEGMDRIFAL